MLLGAVCCCCILCWWRYSLNITANGHAYRVEFAENRIRVLSRREPKIKPGLGHAIGYQTTGRGNYGLGGYERKLGFVGWELPDGCWFPDHAIPNCELNEYWISLPLLLLLSGIGLIGASGTLWRKKVYQRDG